MLMTCSHDICMQHRIYNPKTLEMFLAPKQSTATDKSRHGGGIGFQITWPKFAHINVRHACTVRPRGRGRLGPDCAPFEVSGSRSRIASDQASDPQIDGARSRAAVAVAARGCPARTRFDELNHFSGRRTNNPSA